MKHSYNAIAYLLVCVFLMTAACDSGSTSGLGEGGDSHTFSGNNVKFDVKVAATICGTAILEIQDEAFYEYGVDWENGAAVKYKHVFCTTFPCFTEVSTGEVIEIQLVDKLEPSECARCEAYLETPDKKYIVKVVK